MTLLLLVWFMISPIFLQTQHERTEHWRSRAAQFQAECDTLPKGRIIFLGNSITEGFDLSSYFPELQPLNRGISGDHIDGLIERLDYSVLRLKPAKLFILIGINDIGAGDPDSLILDNYRNLLQIIHDKLPDTHVYIQSILPTTEIWSNCPARKIRYINQILEKYTAQFAFTWINLYSGFVNEKDYMKQIFTSDGLHLNSTGYRHWTDMLKQYLR
jgi:lysophospholipase L1-like esterase